MAFKLSGMIGPEPALFSSMRHASGHARAYAALERVDVWAEQASGALLLVGRFRHPSQR